VTEILEVVSVLLEQLVHLRDLLAGLGVKEDEVLLLLLLSGGGGNERLGLSCLLGDPAGLSLLVLDLPSITVSSFFTLA
jgi:hypothetical protein